MNQHDAPAYTVATIGDPANKVMIVKTTAGHWVYIDRTGPGHMQIEVDDEDFRAGWQPYVPVVITEESLGCHEGCAQFVGGAHLPEVNPVCGGPRWRLECPDCGTVLSLHDTRDEAVRVAVDHATSPSQRDA